MRELSALQRDLLDVVAAYPDSNGARIWGRLEELRQQRIKDNTVYRNLDELDELGLIEKRVISEIENEYRLTEDGRDLLDREAEWVAER